jgi:ubiquinone/menaquinone biosynthesis C-methylase UbiE
MKHPKIFKNLARYYDLIESSKDYKSESEYLKKLIVKNKKSKGNELLEVACGTGSYLKYLKNNFKCVGTDVNEEMLKIARKKVKGVKLSKKDMIDFNLNKKFDVILCLFASIGFVKTEANLKKTIVNFSNHLNPGGIVIIDPWLTKSEFKPELIYATTFNSKDEKMVRLTIYKLKNKISIIDTQYLMVKKGGNVNHIVDQMQLGLFDTKTILNLMEKSGIKTRFLKKEGFGRGLFVGVKE